MYKISSLTKSICFFCLFFTQLAFVEAQATSRWDYIQRYKDIAKREKERAGIPASIKLAQGILESGDGKSTLAREANNHFGMKCGADWRGETYFLKDDDYDENGVLKESCFRVFKSPEESYIAHSEFLRDPNKAYRYGFLFRLNPNDYKGWAQGLKQAGYATSPTYADALISLIDQYKLYEYDLGGLGIADIILINDVKMVSAKAGQTPAAIAQQYKVKLKCLLAYNEGIKGVNQPLKVNERIFLQKKRRFFRGGQHEHYMKSNETMYDVAQLYGMRLKSLYRKNKMSVGQEAAAGEKIYLRGWGFFRKSPKLRDGVVAPEPSNPFDEGTGKSPVDDTNQVDPEDLKNTNNSNTNGSNNTNSTNNPNSTKNNNGSTTTNSTNNSNATNPTKNNNENTTTNGNTTANNQGNTNNTNSTNNQNNTSTNTTNNSNNTTSSNPTKNNNGTNTTNSNTTNNGSTTTQPNKPSSGTNSTGVKPTTPSNPTGTNNPTKPNTPSSTPTTKPNTTVPTTTGTTTTTSTTKPEVVVPKPTGSTTTTPDTRPTGVQYHTVEKGETLYSISKRYGMTVDGLKKLNDLKDNNIKLGQQLRLN
jgi:Mannosyl-glycoprotein endo-beta-N-acetylglucosaminidase/LysM domain